MTGLKSDFVPLSKAVQILGVSPSTLYRYEKVGLLKAYRTAGGHRRYSISELTSFLEKMKCGDFPNQRSVAQFSLRRRVKDER